jgi:CubicO group peptidase (beta-lactamase class C family)
MHAVLLDRAQGAIKLRCMRWIVVVLLSFWAVRAAPCRADAAPAVDIERLHRGFARAEALPRLQALVVAHRGQVVAERRFAGPGLDQPVNIKSVSKSIISALVGIAIERSELEGVEQSIAPFFTAYLKKGDRRLREITIGHLLSMQSGLVRTSGSNYGAWTASRNWVAYILNKPLLADPGGPMIYSTGNTHLLSAILTRATRQSTFAYARKRLAEPLGVELPAWLRDPQGIYFGGNEMRLSAHALLRFGELYRNNGRVGARQVVPEAWVRASWTPRTRSMLSGAEYGYGWFVSELRGRKLYYAWGYGGQFVFVLPQLELTVVTTSNPAGARDFDHLGEIYAVLRECIIPAIDPALASPTDRC